MSSEHSPTPRYVTVDAANEDRDWREIRSQLMHGRVIEADRYSMTNGTTTYVYNGVRIKPEDAEFIVRAANCHDELLEALKSFIKQWNACGPNSDFGRYFKATRDTAEAAIAKATGEQT